MNDKCISFNLDNNAFRGRIVRLDDVIAEVFSHRQYPDNIAASVAETSSLGVMLASLMKFDGLFTLQIYGDGPVSALICDVTSDGKVRSYAQYDEQKMIRAQELRKPTGQIEATPFLLGKGNLVFTIDQGKSTDAYQGIVDLQGKTLAECALRYFKYSEQIDTYLQLYLYKKGDVWNSAGILIQKMPSNGGKEVSTDSAEISEKWNECKILIDSLTKEELFSENLELKEILYRLFHEHELRIVKENEYKFGCRCSREKLVNTLSTMKPDDIEAMVENGKITATCNFCGQEYSFDKSEFIKH